MNAYISEHCISRWIKSVFIANKYKSGKSPGIKFSNRNRDFLPIRNTVKRSVILNTPALVPAYLKTKICANFFVIIKANAYDFWRQITLILKIDDGISGNYIISNNFFPCVTFQMNPFSIFYDLNGT